MADVVDDLANIAARDGMDMSIVRSVSIAGGELERARTRIAELEAAITQFADRIHRQVTASNSYADSKDPITYKICNSHFNDIAAEMRAKIRDR